MSKISDPVKIFSDSSARVAYDLMIHIAFEERLGVANPVVHDRKFWLSLYKQCYKAADGRKLESILRTVK
jgi:hypothetical protein